MFHPIGRAAVPWLRRLPSGETIQLCLNLRDAGQLRLEFLDDLLDLGGQTFELAVRWGSWRSRWAGFPAWASGTDDPGG